MAIGQEKGTQVAKLDKYRYPDIEFEGDDWMARFDAEIAELNRLRQQTMNLPEGKVVGALVSFPYADGAANYIVIKERPLTLQWIGFGDGWSIPDAHIRGLNKADILQMIDRDRGLARLFAERTK